MSKVKLERVIEEVKQLTGEEKRQLRGMIDAWLPSSPQEWTVAEEAALRQSLVTQGSVTHVPSFAPDAEQIRTRKTVSVTGPANL